MQYNRPGDLSPHTKSRLLLGRFAHLSESQRVGDGRLADMEVHFRAETESRLRELASKSGRQPSDLIEDAMAGYLRPLRASNGSDPQG